MRHAGLGREAVVRAAVEIADTQGIEHVSMRRVSQLLGVTPMAIYRHLPGKDALVDLVLDESLRGVPTVDPAGDLFVELRRFFGGLYDLMVSRPGLARAMAERPLEGTEAIRMGDAVLTLLERNGLGEQDAVNVLVSAFGLALGSALYRTSRRQAGAAGTLTEVGDEAPTVRRSRRRIAAARAGDTQFHDALQRLVAGYLPTALQP